ncbi:Monooxygenase OS=Streptomyces cyaneofuscatus OX=66883 GN=G3I52_09025 PE=4 SV=1 [Streptomyces cyaneofuscatus]
MIHLTDPDARAVYGTEYVLVRPDQHVAWRGAVLYNSGARAVLDRVLGRARPGAAAEALGSVPAPRVL